MNNIKFKVKVLKKKYDQQDNYGVIRAGANVPYGSLAKWQKISGIYYIKNKETNKLYIGSSKDIGRRISKHFSQLKVGNHPNHQMLSDYNKYGPDAFEFGTFEIINEDLFEKEKEYQLKHGISNLYNLQIKDTYHSFAQRRSWKTANKDSYKTKEYRDKMRKLKQNKIGQFDKNDGTLLNIYENSDEACKASGLAKSTLLGCCNGSKKSGAGYVWRYLDKDNNVIHEGKGRKRTIVEQNEDIVCLTPKGDKVKTYNKYKLSVKV